jgi:hypothetical protein
VTGLDSNPTLTIGGSPIVFTVTITNRSAASYPMIAPLVAMDRCSCADGSLGMAPEGTLELRQPDGSWRAIPYVRIGGGMDYVAQTQVAGLSLAAGASASYTYRVSFKPATTRQFTSGTTRIEIDVVPVPNPDLTRLESTAVPIQVTTG